MQALNDTILNAVVDYQELLVSNRAKVDLVDGDAILAAFDAHESPMPFCGSAPPSIEGTFIQAKPTGQLDLAAPPRNGDDCFHPNPQGHTAMALLVEQALDVGT